MKQTLTTLLILFTIGLMSVGLVSCRKDNQDPDIKQYDQEKIDAYIKANGLTMTRDLSGGDTTGIYYQILKQGTGAPVDYSDRIFYVYKATSLDGKYSLSDTILNHTYEYVGHLVPAGVQLAVKNILKNRGTQARLLIPSRLAYGRSGTGTGSTRLPGNESLDYYIYVVDPKDQAAYDDLSIRNYIKANNLTGYTKTASGLYYRVDQPGTGTNHVTDNSTVSVQFTGKFLNNTIFDGFNAADTTGSIREYSLLPKGWQEGLKYVTKGGKLSLIIPSALAYGLLPSNPYSFTGYTPPANSCLYYDFNIESITN